MGLTENQQLAKDIRDANVLVSAAAGSGKTRVLVERIIARITDPDDPVDIDRLLVMTFTNAAASEMRERIRDAIDDRINEGGSDGEMLEKQSILVHNAKITTIHGFCKSVITDHFDEVSLDPDFRVADENESRLIRQDALEECMENAYKMGDESFIRTVECFSPSKSDSGIEKLLVPLYEFISADPEPEEFLEKCKEQYLFGSFDDFVSSRFMKELEEHILNEIRIADGYIKQGLDIIDEMPALTPYKANLDAYADAFSGIFSRVKNIGPESEGGEGKDTCEADAKDSENTGKHIYDIVRSGINSINAPAFSRISKKDIGLLEAEGQAKVKNLRDRAKERIKKLSDMMAFNLEDSYMHISESLPLIEGISALVLDFSRIYEEKKREANIIDFNDMEHLAIRILKNPEIAALYRQQFVEIYVDEYQDSNMTQEKLVSLICREEPGNVFQVGDVKQSIYRFRHARCDLFIEKYDTYTDDGQNRRILLNDNFRSRREVVDAVNEVFTAVMHAGTGGVEYDEDARLKFAADYYKNDTPCEGMTYRTELVCGTGEELSDEEFTANIVATKIISMIRDGFTVYDKASKSVRRATYRDFTILVRSMKKFEPVFRDVFAASGIPLCVTGREGYFSTIEVKTVLAFLSAVDNPLCDIPLAAVAKSPVGDFSDRDLATVTAIAKNKMPLYERIKQAAESDEADEELKEKCRHFIGLLEHYRVMSGYTPVYTLISEFIENEYKDHVRCMSRCEQRMANLRMLLTKAEDYSRTSFKGLYSFVRYMDQIRKYEIDSGEAGVSSENDDVVKLMTMHASKGLEFPVCFVAGLEKRRNTSDESGKLIWSTSCGFGCDYTDPVRRISAPTLPKLMVREDNRRESMAEEMRILYVAMTRAREKLIMIGCKDEDFFSEEKGAADIEDGFISYIDLLKCALSAGGFKHIDIINVTEDDLVIDRMAAAVKRAVSAEEVLKTAKSVTKRHESLRLLPFVYPHEIDPDLVPKLSVSDLKHRAIQQQVDAGIDLFPDGESIFEADKSDKYIPKFMRKEGETSTGGTFYGTAFHRIMELWDYAEGPEDVTADDVVAFSQKMYEKHRMEKEQVDAIRPEDVAFFLNSALAKRMKAADSAGSLFREQPFVIGMPQSGETVLVQGIIDAYFIEDGKIYVVDYKTDHVSDEQVLKDRYRVQLEYYGTALSRITKMETAGLIIYSTRLKKAISLL